LSLTTTTISLDPASGFEAMRICRGSDPVYAGIVAAGVQDVPFQML
jgi:hypothetical protein